MLEDKAPRSSIDQASQYENLKALMETNTLRFVEDIKELIRQSSIIWSLPKLDTRPEYLFRNQEIESLSTIHKSRATNRTLEHYSDLVDTMLSVIDAAADIITPKLRLRLKHVILGTYKREITFLQNAHKLTEPVRHETKKHRQSDDKGNQDPGLTWTGKDVSSVESVLMSTDTTDGPVTSSDRPFDGSGIFGPQESFQTQPAEKRTGVVELDDYPDCSRRRLPRHRSLNRGIDPLISTDLDSLTLEESFEIPRFPKKPVPGSNIRTHSSSLMSMNPLHQQISEPYGIQENGSNLDEPCSGSAGSAMHLLNRKCGSRSAPESSPGSYAMDAYLSSKEDPITNLTTSRASSTVSSWMPHHGNTNSHTDAPIAPVDTSLFNSPYEDAYQDLTTLTSATTVSPANSETTSEGERYLDSHELRLEQGPWVTVEEPWAALVTPSLHPQNAFSDRFATNPTSRP